MRDNKIAMFSGLVEKTASVMAREGHVLRVAKSVGAGPGESVSVDGVCLTVTEVTEEALAFDISEETARRTTLGGLEAGDQVNLEPALRVDGRFGGHLVQGHVDGLAYLMEREQVSGSVEMWFESNPEITRYIVEKGSIAIDGVSLTVVSVKDDRFTVSVIPRTLDSTTLRHLKPGDPVNVEVDIIAKYVEKLLPASATGPQDEQTGPAEATSGMEELRAFSETRKSEGQK